MSDRRGRKPYIVFGLLSYAVISLGFMMASSVETLIILRFFHGIASAMIMPVAQAYIGDITPDGKEGVYMGFFNIAMFAGLSLGPFMGGIINTLYGLSSAFAGMGIFAIIAFLLSYLFLPKVEDETATRSKKRPDSWRIIISNKKVLGLASLRFSYTICVGVIWCFLPLYMNSHFKLGSSSSGSLVMIMVLVGALFHAPFGYIADRTNKKSLMVLGSMIICLSMLSFEWAKGFYHLLFSVSLFGIGGGIALPALSAMAVSEGKKKNAIGSVMSLLTMAHSMGMFVGSLIAGLTMDYVDLSHAFPVGAFFMLVGVMFMLWCIDRKSEAFEPKTENGKKT
jgi:MFS family permease